MPERPDRVDANLLADRLEHVEVGVRPPFDPAVVAEQLGRERDRRGSLADPARPVEQVGVRRAFVQRGGEKALRLLLLKHALEAHP